MNYNTNTLTGFAQDFADRLSKLAELGRAAVESGTNIGSTLRAKLQEEITKANHLLNTMSEEAQSLGVVDELPF